MVKTRVQYMPQKDCLHYIYRAIILRWEFDWISIDFNTNLGRLKEFEKRKDILLKSVPSIEMLNEQIKHYNRKNYYGYNGAIFFLKGSYNKPKEILRHIRNAFAHGNFRIRTINKLKCIAFENRLNGNNNLRIFGHIPCDELKPLVAAIMTTQVN